MMESPARRSRPGAGDSTVLTPANGGLLTSLLFPFALEKTGLNVPTDLVADASDEEEPIPGKYMGGKKGKALCKLVMKAVKMELSAPRGETAERSGLSSPKDKATSQLSRSDDPSAENMILDSSEGTRGKRPPSHEDASDEGVGEAVSKRRAKDDGSPVAKDGDARPPSASIRLDATTAVSTSESSSSKAFWDNPLAAVQPRARTAKQSKKGRAQQFAAQLVASEFGLPSTLYFTHSVELPTTLNLPSVEPLRIHSTALMIPARNKNTGLFFKVGPGAVAFRVVLHVFSQSGLVHTNHPNRWNVLWAKRVTPQEWGNLTEYQKVNHFPGTWAIGRKDALAMNIQRMRRTHGAEAYGFVPQTYLLPQDARLVELEFERNPGQTFIVKPAASSCGRGIKLISKLPANLLKEKEKDKERIAEGKASHVVQRYIGNPFLIDGFKFDLRLYVLVTSFEPLRIYLFNEGLVRFATERYPGSDKALTNVYMHLTNYSINKQNSNFISPTASTPGPRPASASRAGGGDPEEEEEEEEGAAKAAESEMRYGLEASKWT
eukprot:RCo010599